MRILAFAAIVVGAMMFVMNAAALFSDAKVSCNGEAMHPGERCGIPTEVLSGRGKTYQQMARDNVRSKVLACAGIPVFGAGIAGMIILARRQR